jgi:hypothetical protein
VVLPSPLSGVTFSRVCVGKVKKPSRAAMYLGSMVTVPSTAGEFPVPAESPVFVYSTPGSEMPLTPGLGGMSTTRSPERGIVTAMA